MRRPGGSARRATISIYTGGFLGPFGGAMLVALIPTIADDLATTDGLVAGAITAYMIPFAVLQLVSGTLAERYGGGRVVRIGYVMFGAAALACALAPDIWSFIAARAGMGAANAFLSPILLAALSDAVEPGALGRAVGTFAAFQVAGLTLAPVLGGALGEISWRLGFGLITLVAAALALAGVALRQRERRERTPPTLRSLLNPWIGLVAATAMAGYLGFTAIGFVVSLVGERDYGLGSGASGLLVAAYGAGGIVLGRLGGVSTDRMGRPRTALLGSTACAAGVLGLAFAPSAWSLGLVYFGVGCASAFAWAALNTIAVESFPENRTGAVSAYGAFKFAGVAVAPLLYVPLLDRDTRLPFFVATGFSLLFGALVLPWFRRYERTAVAGTAADSATG